MIALENDDSFPRDPQTAPERALACARILQAFEDYRDQDDTPCEHCDDKQPIWQCARVWLESEECAELCDSVGVDYDAMLDRLDALVGPVEE